MDEFFRHCRDIIVSNDGILDKVMGDAVFALFNVPIGRDDHVVRAVTTAERIRETAPLLGAVDGESGLLRVGIGVSTGVAYTAMAGSDDCRDYTVIGDVVNVASRLQAQAKPDEILVTEQVYREVIHAFPEADMREMELKGIPEPVRAYSIS